MFVFSNARQQAVVFSEGHWDQSDVFKLKIDFLVSAEQKDISDLQVPKNKPKPLIYNEEAGSILRWSLRGLCEVDKKT